MGAGQQKQKLKTKNKKKKLYDAALFHNRLTALIESILL